MLIVSNKQKLKTQPQKINLYVCIFVYIRRQRKVWKDIIILSNPKEVGQLYVFQKSKAIILPFAPLLFEDVIQISGNREIKGKSNCRM